MWSIYWYLLLLGSTGLNAAGGKEEKTYSRSRVMLYKCQKMLVQSQWMWFCYEPSLIKIINKNNKNSEIFKNSSFTNFILKGHVSNFMVEFIGKLNLLYRNSVKYTVMESNKGSPCSIYINKAHFYAIQSTSCPWNKDHEKINLIISK